MGFFSGTISYTRFRIPGYRPGDFGEEFLERLSAMGMGSQRVASKDGVTVGWIAGEHILDRNFQLEKNVINETLGFALRVDVNKLPTDLLKAYAAEELLGLPRTTRAVVPPSANARRPRRRPRTVSKPKPRTGAFSSGRWSLCCGMAPRARSSSAPPRSP